MPKILVTGGAGLIGSLLVEKLRAKYGQENVVASVHANVTNVQAPFVHCDITKLEDVERAVKDHKIEWIFHMAALLNMACEQNPQAAQAVNVLGFQNVIEVARIHKLRLLSATSTAAFGPTTPKIAPDVTIQKPTGIYGCTKVHNELIGEYYHRKFGVDFRCLRYPNVIARSAPKGRVTDYMYDLFGAIADPSLTCHCDVAEYTSMPYVLLEDAIDGTVQLMEAPNEQLTLRTYNFAAFSATVGELVEEIRKHVDGYQIVYEPNATKQALLDSLPDAVDDSNARRDWNWRPKYDRSAAVKELVDRVRNRQAVNQ